MIHSLLRQQTFFFWSEFAWHLITALYSYNHIRIFLHGTESLSSTTAHGPVAYLVYLLLSAPPHRFNHNLIKKFAFLFNRNG